MITCVLRFLSRLFYSRIILRNPTTSQLFRTVLRPVASRAQARSFTVACHSTRLIVRNSQWVISSCNKTLSPAGGYYPHPMRSLSVDIRSNRQTTLM